MYAKKKYSLSDLLKNVDSLDFSSDMFVALMSSGHPITLPISECTGLRWGVTMGFLEND